MTTGSPPPTLDEIEQALQAWREWGRYRGCVDVVDRLAACLRSGEYALIHAVDRALALDKMLTAGVADAKGYTDVATERHAEARRLLHLARDGS